MPIEGNGFHIDQSLMQALNEVPDDDDILTYGLNQNGRLVKPTSTTPVPAEANTQWQNVVKKFIPIAGRSAIPAKHVVPYFAKTYASSNSGWAGWFSSLLPGSSGKDDIEAPVSTIDQNTRKDSDGHPIQCRPIHLCQSASVAACLKQAAHAHDAKSTLIIGSTEEDNNALDSTLNSLHTLLNDDPVNRVDLDGIIKRVMINKKDGITNGVKKEPDKPLIIKLKQPNQLNLQYLVIYPFFRAASWDQVLDQQAWDNRYQRVLESCEPIFLSPNNQPLIVPLGPIDDTREKDNDAEGILQASITASMSSCMKWIHTLPSHSVPTIIYPPDSKVYSAFKQVASDSTIMGKKRQAKVAGSQAASAPYSGYKDHERYHQYYQEHHHSLFANSSLGEQVFYIKGEPFYSLTNFHKGAEDIEIDGEKYATTEMYFQCCKFKKNSHSWKDVKNTSGTSDTWRKAGELFKPDNPDRLYKGEEWGRKKDQVMWKALLCKAEQDMVYRSELLSTGDNILVEDSPSDKYWGVGADRRGENTLGYMHMAIRDMLLRDEIH